MTAKEEYIVIHNLKEYEGLNKNTQNLLKAFLEATKSKNFK